MKEIKKNNFLYKRINIFMFLNIFYYYFNKKIIMILLFKENIKLILQYLKR